MSNQWDRDLALRMAEQYSDVGLRDDELVADLLKAAVDREAALIAENKRLWMAGKDLWFELVQLAHKQPCGCRICGVLQDWKEVVDDAE